MKVTQLGDQDDIILDELKKQHKYVSTMLREIEKDIREIVYKYDTLKIDYSKRPRQS